MKSHYQAGIVMHACESAANSWCQVPSCSSALHNLLREHGWASNWMSLRARIAEKCSGRKPVDTCHGVCNSGWCNFDKGFFSIGMLSQICRYRTSPTSRLGPIMVCSSGRAKYRRSRRTCQIVFTVCIFEENDNK